MILSSVELPVSMQRYEKYNFIIEPLNLHNPSNSKNISLIALTVDVEDWYQSCIDFEAPITERVVRNVNLVLSILDEKKTKCTFFVQGLVAEKFPFLLRDIISEGHELQSHGYSHKPLHKMDRQSLYEELKKAKHIIEDASGISVTAFRAPDFTIFLQNFWALETLTELGFKYDSSIFPMRTRNYGITGWETKPHKIILPNGNNIIEVPVAIWSKRNLPIPVAGGGYFRLLPYRFLKMTLNVITKKSPAIIYCHPYEFNKNELIDYKSVTSTRFRFYQGVGRGGFTKKIQKLIRDFPVGRLDDVIKTWGIS